MTPCGVNLHRTVYEVACTRDSTSRCIFPVCSIDHPRPYPPEDAPLLKFRKSSKDGCSDIHDYA